MAAGVLVIDKDKNIEVRMVPVDRIVSNDWNPNEMSGEVFDALVKDMGEGFYQPILVTPFRSDSGAVKFRVIDGEHRYAGMKLMDMPKVPCVVARGDLSKKERDQMIKTVRMNKIRGNLNQKKFDALVNRLATEMPLEDLAREFIMDESDLQKIISQERDKLPNEEMKKALDAAKKEIKTIDDLSTVLNNLFAKYGDNLDYNYMVLDFGGKDHLWIRTKDRESFLSLRKKCEMIKTYGVTVDSVIMHVLDTEITEDMVAENVKLFDRPGVAK